MLSPHWALWSGCRACFIGGDAEGTSRAYWARAQVIRTHKERQLMAFILWILAVILVVWGIVRVISSRAKPQRIRWRAPLLS